jgi:hypothetical protein
MGRGEMSHFASLPAAGIVRRSISSQTFHFHRFLPVDMAERTDPAAESQQHPELRAPQPW